MRYYLSSGRRRKSIIFEESDKLGRGASATVYRVTVGSKIFAAKIYHDDKVINLAKINAMLNEVPKECLVIKDGIEYPQLAWPTDIIYDDVGDPSGILLPLVDTTESFTLDHYYDRGLFKKLGSPDEAAWRMGWIDKAAGSIESAKNSSYTRYLDNLTKDLIQTEITEREWDYILEQSKVNDALPFI